MIVVKKTQPKLVEAPKPEKPAGADPLIAALTERLDVLNQTTEIIGLIAKDILEKPRPELVAEIQRDANGKMKTITIRQKGE